MCFGCQIFERQAGIFLSLYSVDMLLSRIALSDVHSSFYSGDSIQVMNDVLVIYETHQRNLCTIELK